MSHRCGECAAVRAEEGFGSGGAEEKARGGRGRESWGQAAGGQEHVCEGCATCVMSGKRCYSFWFDDCSTNSLNHGIAQVEHPDGHVPCGRSGIRDHGLLGRAHRSDVRFLTCFVVKPDDNHTHCASAPPTTAAPPQASSRCRRAPLTTRVIIWCV